MSDPVGYVRANPGIFFRDSIPDPIACAMQLVGEVLCLGGADVAVHRVDEWWIVQSSFDWFLPDRSPSEQVMALIPLPQLGVNTSRYEIAIFAFARSMATRKSPAPAWTVLCGQAPPGELTTIVGRQLAFEFARSG